MPEELRFETIASLLRGLYLAEASVIYGSAKKDQFTDAIDPIDLCFRICLTGIHDRIQRIEPQQLVLLIVDEMDKDLRKVLRKSFREHRQKLRTMIFPPTNAWRFHDAMYFGSSVDSVGLQVADLCALFIGKHKQASDPKAEEFYKMIENCIAFKVEHDRGEKDESVETKI